MIHPVKEPATNQCPDLNTCDEKNPLQPTTPHHPEEDARDRFKTKLKAGTADRRRVLHDDEEDEDDAVERMRDDEQVDEKVDEGLMVEQDEEESEAEDAAEVEEKCEQATALAMMTVFDPREEANMMASEDG
ncbi:hypothetical protein HDU67_005999 [Dinochytrium kinnereticum]|nr:hypothetical protein HDU67_005999 [Dinochytrium kinnereticum]